MSYMVMENEFWPGKKSWNRQGISFQSKSGHHV